MYGLAILGAGAGGTGPLVWAAQNARLASWLDAGIAMVEQASTPGGDIGKYVIDADSMGTSFLECLDAPATSDLFAGLRADPITQTLECYRRGYPPLALVGQFMRRLGDTLAASVAGHPRGAFLGDTAAHAIHVEGDGTLRVRLSSGDMLSARSVLVALGGRQDMSAVHDAEPRPGLRLAGMADKIMPSDRLMTAAGLAEAAHRLTQAHGSRIVVLGGSHSAFSAAWLLLEKLAGVLIDAGGLTILHRRPPRVFYPTRDAARADGYPVSDRDVCPVTRRVHRLGGLRNHGRELWRRLTGRPGTVPEPRVRMLSLADPAVSSAEVRRILDDAALIVAATGYRLRTIPVFDPHGRRLGLAAERTGPAVGRDCRLRLLEGGGLANVFAIGLGSGYQPWGRMGGEPTFDGQQNSLWLYQNDIGGVIHDGVQHCLSSAAWRVRPAAAAEAAGPMTTALATVPP